MFCGVTIIDGGYANVDPPIAEVPVKNGFTKVISNPDAEVPEVFIVVLCSVLAGKKASKPNSEISIFSLAFSLAMSHLKSNPLPLNTPLKNLLYEPKLVYFLSQS